MNIVCLRYAAVDAEDTHSTEYQRVS
jgi:hypothetical protein